MIGGLQLISGALSDVGKKRSLNEDYYLVEDSLGLMVVADGMGGHGAGDIASELAATSIHRYIESFLNGNTEGLSPIDDDDITPLTEADADSTVQALPNPVISVVSAAVRSSNRAVYDKNKASGFADGAGMGTTVAGIWRLGQLNEIVLFQVGDSRIYLYRSNRLICLTRDHTAYQEWERNGRTGPAPPQNIILRAIGLFANVNAEVRIQSVHDKDIILICSDGLTAMLDDKEIEQIFSVHHHDITMLTSVLVDRANAAGGDDNITVVVGRYENS